MNESGKISIHSENIFPIIKKFLYSDNEIFLRELVSNAVDATQKIKHLAAIGEFKGDLGELKVKVALDEKAKTITISDSGIGMSAEDIKKYINQIAFSGATEFVEKYKDKSEADVEQIIGNFGLGFYSAYMVAGNVEINTLSHVDGSESAHWECDGSTSFTIKEGSRKERGTDIVLHISDDGKDYLNAFKLKEVLTKYGKFLPIEIEFNDEVINNPNPLWIKPPSELKDEDYIAFYKELYPMSEDPLFWIHLNVDFPFNLTGVLYFPKIKNEMEIQKNKIQLFSKQVFITDEVKDVVPEFLMLLHGVIDSPDIPLNVSRSFLQADSNVKKINSHITKKVADKLAELYKKDAKSYEEKWDDVSVFVKYGMISEEKFYAKSEKFCLYKTTEGKLFNLQELKDVLKGQHEDKEGNTVILYASSLETQDAYIQSAEKKGYTVLVLDGPIDSHFVSTLEQKLEKVQLKRVDSDSVEKLIDKGESKEVVLSDDEKTKVEELFKKVVNDESHQIQIEALAPEDQPVSLTKPEFMRRMADMQRVSGMGVMGDMPESFVVVVNGNHPLINDLLKAEGDKQLRLGQHVYDLARLSQGILKGKELTTFINRSLEVVN